MSGGNDSPPIIHKKKKKSHGGHHGGAWKVAYADFVTAMMALFIVLWVLSQSEEVKEAVAGYFKDPVGFQSGGSMNLLDGKQNNVIDLDMQNEALMRENEKKELAKMGEAILEELSDNEEFKDMLDQIQIEVIEEGLRIEMIESTDDIFFEIGTAHLKPEAFKLIQKIGTQIAKRQNKIIVEGHTDSRPYSGDGTGYTNFELSTERANSARRALTLGGVIEAQIDEVRGFADKRLRDANDPYSAINRRISIILKFTEKK
ncbi:MAG: OmpA family protein [Ignavibacteriales bacterium]|nr:MAG: OmpA family protein [Ignavibacteriales bacterium]